VRHSLAFLLQNAEVEKSSEFKSVEYSGQYVEIQNSANSCKVIWAEKAGAESAKRSIFHKVRSFWTPGAQMLSKKLLIGIGVGMFASETAFVVINLPLSLIASLLSTPWLSGQVQAFM
jgi:hypothetical protein